MAEVNHHFYWKDRVFGPERMEKGTVRNWARIRNFYEGDEGDEGGAFSLGNDRERREEEDEEGYDGFQ